MQRFFVGPECCTENFVLVYDPQIIHQITNVLRMRSGDECIFLDNSGFEFLSEITSLDEKEIRAAILEKRKNLAEPALFVTLYQALPKKLELFEWVLQKGTEIGISKFVPLVTERTERREIPKRERLEKILKEAAEQCERGRIPELGEVIDFSRAIKSISPGNSVLLSGLGNQKLHSSPMNILVGPEGGFSEKEINETRAIGIPVAALGLRVLRTETAGIAAASLILLR